MFLIDLAAYLSEWVLRTMPKRWQRVVEPDSPLGVALGFLLALVGLGCVVALLAFIRS